MVSEHLAFIEKRRADEERAAEEFEEHWHYQFTPEHYALQKLSGADDDVQDGYYLMVHDYHCRVMNALGPLPEALALEGDGQSRERIPLVDALPYLMFMGSPLGSRPEDAARWEAVDNLRWSAGAREMVGYYSLDYGYNLNIHESCDACDDARGVGHG